MQSTLKLKKLLLVAFLIILRQSVQSAETPVAEPTAYVLDKLKHYDLVMIGEHHWRRQEPAFVNELVKRCYQTHAIDFLFLEFGDFALQKNVESFLQAEKYDPRPIIEVLRNNTVTGWGYQEYLDIFKTVYIENHARPENRRIRIVMVDGPPSTISLDPLYRCLEKSPLEESAKWEKVSWLREGIAGRDPFMAEVIAMHLFDKSRQKGIYYCGSSHIRTDLKQKVYGLRYFSAGGLLSRKYPGRVFALAFDRAPQDWRESSRCGFFEELYGQRGEGFGMDTADPRIGQFMLNSDVTTNGVPLDQAFDGYIVLRPYKDYRPCAIIPGFYDDQFAEVVWTRCQKEGLLNQLPRELEKFKSRPWSGEQLVDLMKQGFRSAQP